MTRPALFLAAFALACGPGDPAPTGDPTPTDTPAPDPLSISPDSPQTLGVGDQVSFDVTDVDPDQAYRVTLVHGDNITWDGDGNAVFVDSGTGTANAGPSDSYAGLFHVQYGTLPALAKTHPAATDDPAAPSAIFPINGMVSFGVEGVAAGSVYPVIYHNGGESTFLEIDENGSAIEHYIVGPEMTIEAPPPPPPVTVEPSTPVTIAPGETYDYTITGLNDAYKYRITLVVAANITTPGDGTGSFVDSGTGTANAGNSQDYALITYYNTTYAVDPPAKTIPAATDDPANPTGITPSGGEITVTIEGVADGTVYPVAYRNYGASTFLEIDGSGYPTESYGVGGSLTVATP
ncbi:MAG: hypothetical protein KC656_10710 [Myxococcales bacterium]|nr:hypothetical protein [Myxococcales bacterium]